MNLKKIVAIAAVTVLAVSSFAQGGGQGRRGFGMFGGGAFGAAPSMLLGRDDVKEELKLTDDQKAKILDIVQGERTRRREAMQNSGISFQPGQAPDADTMKKMMELGQKVTEETNKEIAKVLDEGQQKRLKEIRVQFMGNAVANSPEFQKDLGVTAEQKTKLEDLQKKQGDAMRALGEKMRNQEMDFAQFREAMEKNNKIMNDEIGKVLTDDQKKKITEWSGKTFTRKDDPQS